MAKNGIRERGRRSEPRVSLGNKFSSGEPRVENFSNNNRNINYEDGASDNEARGGENTSAAGGSA